MICPLDEPLTPATEFSTRQLMHVYEVRPRKDKCGIDLISDVLPFGRLWCGEPNAASKAIGCVMHRSHSHHAMIRVYDAAGNVMETHEHDQFVPWAFDIPRQVIDGALALSYAKPTNRTP